MSKLKQILLQVAGMIAASQSDDYFYTPQRRTGGISFNSEYKSEHVKRELREFTIKGKKILAYSKKDAIKRLKHKKKNE